VAETNSNQVSSSLKIAQKIRDYYQLMKFTLSFTVVFSCVISYLLAPNIVDYSFTQIIILFIAGLLVTGSANAVNQAVEKDTDALMKRTSKRPVAEGRMPAAEAYGFALFTALPG